MITRVISLFRNLFKKASSMRTGGVLSLGLLMLFINLPTFAFADSHPENDSSGLRVKIRPKDNFPPAPITDLDAVVGLNEGEILLQWTAPKPDDVPLATNGAVSSYVVRYATFSVTNLGGNTTTWWTLATDATGEPAPQNSPNLESMIVTGLEPGATIYFGIRSNDALGNISVLDLPAQYGPQANAQVPDFFPPTVTGVSLSVSSNSINISWAASTATDVTSYQIYMDTWTPGDVFIPTVTVPLGTNNYNFTNLVPLNTYFFYVTALDKGQPNFLGNILESATSTIVSGYPTGVVNVPAAPSNLAGTSITTQTITWQWQDNDSNENGFTLFTSTGGFVASVSASTGLGSIQQYTETGLSPNTAYARYVVAFNGAGNSLPSGTTTRYTLANPPASSIFTSVQNSNITIGWSANSNSGGTTYTVERSTLAGFVPLGLQANTVGVSYTDTGLSGKSTYYYRVRAQNGEGVPTAFDAVISTLTPPTIVSGLTATGGDKQVALDWNDVTDPLIVGYFVYRSSISSVSPLLKVNLTALTSSYFLDTGLTNGVTYYYAVTTVDANPAEGPFSNIVSARAAKPVSKRPQEPTGLLGVLNSSGTFNISWTPVTMDLVLSTTVELAAYRIYKSSAAEGPFYFRDAVASTTTVWNSLELVPPTVWYLVRAVDTSDNESDDSMHIETLPVPVLSAVSTDETARVEFSGEDTKFLRAATNNRSEDLRVVVNKKTEEEKGNIMSSYEIKSYGAASGTEIKDVKFNRPTVNLQFRFAKGLRAPYIKPGTAFRYAGSTLKDVGVFWHNTVEFVKFGGTINELTGVVSVKTASPLGRYQVRQVLRATEFSIMQITPRKIFTPNGDGVNDEITLYLENPNDSVISQAKVFDLTGAEVADFEQGIVAGAQGVVSLKWNGKDRSGNYVRSGVYVYQVQSDGKTLNGTMVVAR